MNTDVTLLCFPLRKIFHLSITILLSNKFVTNLIRSCIKILSWLQISISLSLQCKLAAIFLNDVQFARARHPLHLHDNALLLVSHNPLVRPENPISCKNVEQAHAGLHKFLLMYTILDAHFSINSVCGISILRMIFKILTQLHFAHISSVSNTHTLNKQTNQSYFTHTHKTAQPVVIQPWDGRSRVQIPTGEGYVFSPKCPDCLWGPPTYMFKGQQELISRGKAAVAFG